MWENRKVEITMLGKNTGARNHRESIPKIGKRIICLKTLSNKKEATKSAKLEKLKASIELAKRKAS